MLLIAILFAAIIGISAQGYYSPGYYGNSPYNNPSYGNPFSNPYGSPPAYPSNYGGPPECQLPAVLFGEWFSQEGGQNIFTQINAQQFLRRTGNSISTRRCLDWKQNNNANFTIVTKDLQNNCYFCTRINTRTINVIEWIETSCLNLPSGDSPTIANVCRNLDPEKESTFAFATSPTPKNCRSSLEGVWQFSYRRIGAFSDCSSHEANITSCQQPGTQFNSLNQEFTINYRKCDAVAESQDHSLKLTCLGDWRVGNKKYFAAMNSRESRPEEKYRCFLTDRNDDSYIAMSSTAECNSLRSPQAGPERLKLTPIKSEAVTPKCTLPHNFTGNFVNTGNFDAEVQINSTHMIETWQPDTNRKKREIYVCQEHRDSRYMFARLGVNGCEKDYVCFDFVPRHHNIIRYRKSSYTSSDRFSSVCSWSMFTNNNDEEWKYDLMLANPITPIRCPIGGKFRFEQKGDEPLANRIRGGIRAAPRPNTYCRENVSDLSICDSSATQLQVTVNYCLSVDSFGRPVDLFWEPDYTMSCIGYFKENMINYLITWDESDPYSRYRCWIYQRADLNKIFLSLGLSGACHIRQTALSGTAETGAQVALTLLEAEREGDFCPLWYEDDYKGQSSHILKPLRAYKSSALSGYSSGFVHLVLSQLIYYLLRHF